AKSKASPAPLRRDRSEPAPAHAGPSHVECRSLFTLRALTQEESFEGLPPFAVRACPDVLLAPARRRPHRFTSAFASSCFRYYKSPAYWAHGKRCRLRNDD